MVVMSTDLFTYKPVGQVLGGELNHSVNGWPAPGWPPLGPTWKRDNDTHCCAPYNTQTVASVLLVGKNATKFPLGPTSPQNNTARHHYLGRPSFCCLGNC
jgi:hypothetical protein